MNKLIKILFVVSLLFVGGCSSKDNNEQKLKDTEVSYKDNVIALNENIENIVKNLGEPNEKNESKSCLYEGYDKEFIYTDLMITTYPKEDKDYVSCITVTSKDVSLAKEVFVGDHKDKIYEKYGKDCVSEDDYSITYEYGNYGFVFYLNDSIIEQYDLYLIQE